MSGTKLRYKITFIEIRKLYSAKLSSEMYFKTKYNKQVLIDDLANR